MTDNTVIFGWNILADIGNESGIVVTVETIDNRMVFESNVNIVNNNNNKIKKLYCLWCVEASSR